MRARNALVLILIAAAGSAGLTYWYMSTRSAPATAAGGRTEAAPPPLIVTAKPALRSFTVQVPWIGTVESQAAVELTALVGGRVESIEAADQAPVEAGAPIVRLGGPEIEAQRATLKAQIDSLQAQLTLSEQSMARLERSAEQRLATKDQLASAQESRLSLANKLQAAKLAAESVEKQAVLKAPMKGVFTDRRVSPGQAVQVGDVLGRVVDPDHLRIVASLFPHEGAKLAGMEAVVHVGGGKTVSGLIKSVLPEADSTGATIVWIEGPEIDRAIAAGQTVSGQIALEASPAVLAVPESAVVYDAHERPYVFVQQGSEYDRRSVNLGLSQDGQVQVLSGLEAGESVVTSGAYELFYREFAQQFHAED